MSFEVRHIERINDVSGNAFWSCPACRYPIGARIKRSLDKQQTSIDKLYTWPRTLREAGYLVDKTWPVSERLGAPAAVPASVARSFTQAEEARIRDHREAAGMAYRRSLELSLKDIAPSLKGTLERRIDKLALDHRLTPDLATWAHSVRELGNEAAHEDAEPTKEDTEDLAAFTRVVLEYLYTMPAKVLARRGTEPEAIEADLAR